MQQLLCFNISEDAFTFELYFIYFIICSLILWEKDQNSTKVVSPPLNLGHL